MLRRDFVLAWIAYDPMGMVEVKDAFTTIEMEQTTLGFGSRNVRMFVATPDGTALARLGGYWSPEFMARFLDFSRRIDPSRAKEQHAKAIEALAAERDRETEEVRRAGLAAFLAWHRSDEPQPVSQLLAEAARAVQMQGC
jgi:hypothetical protein